MAGHSKWNNIKRKKGAVDAKKAKLYTKFIREIQVSARMGGGDPSTNPRLRDAMAEARANNMPKDNIERAIKRGTGELEGNEYVGITYEGYGPGGVAIIVESLTDNKNRTVAEVRFIMSKNGGNLGESGSVSWMFEKKGVISIDKKKSNENQLMEIALESGAEDIKDEEDCWDVITSPNTLNEVKIKLEENKIEIDEAVVTVIPKNSIKIAGEQALSVLKLMDALEENDDVQKVFSNFEIDSKELERLSGQV